MIKYFYTPFPKPKKTRSNTLKVFLFGFLISLFIIIFKPFNIENDQIWYYNLITLALGLVFSSAIYFMEFLVPTIFKSFFKKWNLGKAVLWYAWIILFVSAVIFITKSFLAGFNDFTFLEYINVIGRISALSLTVSFFILGVISYFNQQKTGILSSNQIYTITAPNVKSLELNLDDILYVVSDDNYVDIHIMKNDKRDKIVFRSSLKNIENQIVNPVSPIYRCHRRYLININHFKIQSDKSRNTSVALKDGDDEIPVSKKYQSDILELLHIRH